VAGTRVAANAEEARRQDHEPGQQQAERTPSGSTFKVDFTNSRRAVRRDRELEGTRRSRPRGPASPARRVCPAPWDDRPAARRQGRGPGRAVPGADDVHADPNDDTNKDNNTKEATLDFSEQSGPDLTVIAEDVKQAAKEVDGNPVYAGDLYAGGQSALTYFIANQGDVASTGLKISVKLPKGVTPTEVERAASTRPTSPRSPAPTSSA
jgi:hypothetical protein